MNVILQNGKDLAEGNEFVHELSQCFRCLLCSGNIPVTQRSYLPRELYDTIMLLARPMISATLG